MKLNYFGAAAVAALAVCCVTPVAAQAQDHYSAAPSDTASGPLKIENGAFEAAVSVDELSRITILGDKIVSVRSLQDPEGPQMLVEAEESTGDVYVGFDGPAMGRTFSLFLVTESGRTVQAKLVASAISGQTIQVAGAVDPSLNAGSSVDRTERRSDYMETITAIVRVMFRGDSPANVRCTVRNGASRDVGPYKLRVVRTCEVGPYRGVEMALQNSSDALAPLLVDPFLVAGVVAAAADRDELQPGASGRVFLVEEVR